eukprot:6210203-Pleurochrysis_carterae.AAC.1
MRAVCTAQQTKLRDQDAVIAQQRAALQAAWKKSAQTARTAQQCESDARSAQRRAERSGVLSESALAWKREADTLAHAKAEQNREKNYSKALRSEVEAARAACEAAEKRARDLDTECGKLRGCSCKLEQAEQKLNE